MKKSIIWTSPNIMCIQRLIINNIKKLLFKKKVKKLNKIVKHLKRVKGMEKKLVVPSSKFVEKIIFDQKFQNF